MELVFEIGCEELPARFVEPGLEQLESMFVEKCDHERIEVSDVRTVGTPRRLTLLVEDLADKQADLSETQTGPPADVAFEDGEPTGAAKGFASAKGVEPNDLYVVDTEKGKYAAADVYEEGQDTHELLPDILEEVLSELHFPKSMRWGDGADIAFGRPVRWLLAVVDGEHVPVHFAGVDSGTSSRGHRFSSPESFEVNGCEDYISELESRDVVVEPHRRKTQIRETLDEMASSVGGEVREDPGLVDEVAHLIEMPNGTLLDYSDEYLMLPDEVLITSMRSHQRYFSIQDPDTGQLMSYAGVIYNTPVETPEKVNEGNLKVLRARLDDAKFFWNKDRQQPLAAYTAHLEDVVWVDAIGSMKNRSERIGNLGKRLGDAFGLETQQREAVERAGLLSKADLVTEMVNEFPSLQGIVGREYARESGESDDVAVAIHEQYLPGGADDDLPSTDIGAIVSIAEKIDAIVGCFGADMQPTSDSDPYGLRRAALGIIRIAAESDYRIELDELVGDSLAIYAKHNGDDVFSKSDDKLVGEVCYFVKNRLRYWLQEDYPTDVVDAVIEVGGRDIKRTIGLVESLSALKEGEDFLPLARGFKRIGNILDKEEVPASDSPDESLLEEPQEQQLFEAYRDVRNQITNALENRDWDRACAALNDMKEPVDAFFDNVMVMTDDEKLHRNRIALLRQLRKLFVRVADIGHIQVD